MRYIKLVINLSLLYSASYASELELSQYVSFNSTLISVTIFILNIVFAFYAYTNLSEILNISHFQIMGNRKKIYQLVSIFAVFVILIGLFVKTDISVVDALVRSLSLILVLLVLDFSKNFSK